MGSGKGGSAPTPPDPMQTAGAQTGMNVGTAIANQMLGMVNQNGPNGSLRYRQTGSTPIDIMGETYQIPQMTANTRLSPQQQRLSRTQGAASQNMAELARDQSGRLGGLLGRPMDLSGAPDVNAPEFDRINAPKAKNYSKDRGRVEKALMSRLNPSLDRDREAMTANLAGKGIKLGSAAYDRAMDELDRTGTDARMQAILAGGQEQSRMAGLDSQRFGDRMAATGFNNQWGQTGFGNDRALRGDFLSEGYAARNQPINEIGALLGTGQVQQPNFVNTPTAQAATTDYAGLVNANHQQQMQAWQQQQAQSQSTLGGLFGLGAAGIQAAPFLPAFSDRRLKTDVTRIGSWKSLPLYLFRYVWGGPMQIGVMAQDVLRVKPQAVASFNGYLAVNYGAL
jgi:hypothetical protein